MISRLDGAPTLPIKDEVDLAIDARAAEIQREYDVTPAEAMQMARADVMQNLDQSGYPTPEAALARLHQEAGASPESATRQAQNQVRVYGPQGAWGLSREYETPEGMAALKRAQAENQAADARHQKMHDDYYTASGAPSHQRVTPETQQMWEEGDRRMAEERRVIRAGLHPQQPVDPGTPDQQARWNRFLENNPDEMARYRPDEAAARQKEQRDAEMEDVFINIRQRYGPDEEAKARAAHARGAIHVPQTAAQRSRNERATNEKYDAMRGNDDARQRLRARDAQVNYDSLTPEQRDALRAPGGAVSRTSQTRWADEAGLTDAEAAGMTTNDLRRNAMRARQAAKEARDAMWRPRTMIRAGNAIGALAVPGIDDWQRQMIAGGPTPLAANALTARQVLNMMNAEALAGMDPFNRNLQRETLEQRRVMQEAGLPPDQKIAVSRSRGEPMGTGLSSGPVNQAWNDAWSEAGFREDMEGRGYSPPEIDAWIDARRNGNRPAGPQPVPIDIPGGP